MGYVAYTGLTGPDDVLEKIADYITGKGYTITQPLAGDVNVFNFSSNDGKRFVFKSKTGYNVYLRSANGINIFGDKVDATMDATAVQSDAGYYGIGMTVGDGDAYNPIYTGTSSAGGRWYNQKGVPLDFNGTKVQGVWMPVKQIDVDGNPTGTKFTLYCNNITTPTDTLIFTVMPEDSKYRPCVHLVYADVNKYEEWTGGAFFSGSATTAVANFAQIKNAYKALTDTIAPSTGTYTAYDGAGNVLPICSSGPASNSFLRINIDEAPTDVRGNVIWASSGSDSLNKGITGKPLSLPIRVGSSTNGEIPHYKYMMSTAKDDWGRNINTLNCVTMNLPLYLAVQVDPDALHNYAAVGTISGLFFISVLNMQSSYTYEMSYPSSGDICQVFSFTKRRGEYGFDGISIRQESD